MAKKKKRKKMSPQALELVAARFKMLSDPTRLQILQTLMEGEKNVGEIQSEVNSSQPNVSKHLNLMIQDGLLSRRKEGVIVFYSIMDETLYDLCESVCEGLQDQFELKAETLFQKSTKVRQPLEGE